MSSLSPKDRVSLCSFTFADGRRCRTPRISSHPHFCYYHAQKEARARAAHKLGKDLDYFFSGDYLSACDLSTALARLIPAVVRGDLKPKTAHTVAYLAQTLMQAIHVSQHEYCEAFDTDDWRQAIRNSVNGNHDYLFPPNPQPAQPESPQPQPPPVAHPARGEESASSSNSSLATRHSLLPPAPQPAPSPHTPLPATSAEFVQQVMAGLQTDGGQAPQPAPAPSPVPQSAETPVNCHSDADPPINCQSERSRPTFSAAFAPANASACVVEESAASSNSSLVTRHFPELLPHRPPRMPTLSPQSNPPGRQCQPPDLHPSLSPSGVGLFRHIFVGASIATRHRRQAL